MQIVLQKKSSHGGVSYGLVPPDVEAGGVSHQLDEFGILGVVEVAVRDPELRNCRGIQFLPSFRFGIKDQGRVKSDVLPSVGYPNLEHDFLTVLIVTNLVSCFNWFSVSDLKSISILNFNMAKQLQVTTAIAATAIAETTAIAT